jgi:DNA-binding SARP family transcriptional activator/predicted ATPase
MPHARAQDSLSIRLLGGVAIDSPEGRNVPVLPRKGWAILAYLSADPGVPQPRDRLAEIFWPTLAVEAARNNLRQVLLGLQRVLKDKLSDVPCLVADRRAIRLDPNGRHRIDLIDFVRDAPECAPNADRSHCLACLSQMETMAALYRGEFMAGFDLPDCADFEDWLQIRREALLQRALILLEHLSLCHEKLGNVDRALAFARRYADLEPWNEEGQRRLMQLLALNGQRAAALSHYESCCRALKQELGVMPEEETRALAKRIQNGRVQASATGGQEGLAVPPLPPMALERRQATVLYCQLVATGSDDPDEVLDLLRAPQARCVQVIQQFFGHVVRTNDGGLLAYFGYPEAREHAALLAVRAGMALAGERFAEVKLRIGIHTGLIITSSDPNLPDPIGRTSNVAVRLRRLARPGEVIVSAATRHLTDGYFEWALQPSPDDSDEPKAFGVVRATQAVTRLGAAASLAPLAGREAEVAALSVRWRQASAGRRQALLVTGDPGIGKSRLVHALKQEIAGTHGVVRELLCLPEFTQTPFQPLIGMQKALFGFTPGDSPETRFRRLAKYQERRYPEMNLDEVIPLFAGLLSLPLAPPYREPTASLQVQRQTVMGIFLEQLHRQAAAQPMLIIVEDLQWCDPTTLELLTRTLADTRPAPIFFLLTARPEFRSPWPEAEVPVQALGPLADDDIGTLVGSLDLDIPADVMQAIVARADGVPLFAEELARTHPPAGAGRPPAVPSTLQDLLAARLDSMADTKSTAQLAAAIGREFPMAWMRALSPLDEATLTASLYRLRDAGILSGTTETEFQFRHALFQDAAYQSLTKTDRLTAHRRIAETLQARFPDAVRIRPETLARHWTAAGETETAIECWVRAGRLANLHCAHKEAIGRFMSGLALVDGLADGQRRIQLEFELQVGLGAAHFAAEGYASPNGAAAYARAVELGERHADSPDLFHALWGLWACTSSRSDYDESLALTQRLLRMALASKDPVKEQQGHFAVGNIRFWRGEFVEARDHLERAMALYKPEHHERLVVDFGENAYATSGSYLSWTLCFLGFPQQAKEAGRKALDEARRAGHPFSLGYALTFATVLARMLRHPGETLTLAEETIDLAVRHGFPLWKVGATLKQGWAMVRLGRPEGMERIRESVASVPVLMSGIRLIFLETMADALCHLKVFDEALTVIAEARDVVDRLGDRHVEAELHRLEGRCWLGQSRSNKAKAEACFDRALSVSRRQQARLLELRAAMAMAELWHGQGRTDEARHLLAGVYDGFVEGSDTHDLRKARSLLSDLG